MSGIWAKEWHDSTLRFKSIILISCVGRDLLGGGARRGTGDSGTPVWEVFQESKRDAGDTREGGNSGNDEKWLDSGYILMVEQICSGFT